MSFYLIFVKKIPVFSTFKLSKKANTVMIYFCNNENNSNYKASRDIYLFI